MKIKNYQIFSILTLLVILSTPPNLALAVGTKPIGEVCQNNSECRSGDCEGSTKKDTSGNKLSYCDCDDKGNSSDCTTEYGTPTTGTWSCSDGADYTYDLDYCYNTKTKETKLPIEPNKNTTPAGNLVDAIFDSPVAQDALLQKVKIIKPTTKILIPGVTFSDLAPTTDKDGYLNIPWIGEYLIGIYNFALTIAAILATIMIIIAGTQWITSGGNSESIRGAKKRIVGSITGLIIAYLSYVVLVTINPGLVELKSLRVKYNQRIPLEDPNEGTEETTVGVSQNTPPGPTTQRTFIPSNINDFCFPVQDFSENRNNWGQNRKQLKCHSGIDLKTKWREKKGTIVAMTNGVVIQISKNYTECSDGPSGLTSPGTKETVGAVYVYDRTNDVTYIYGEINNDSISVSVNQEINKGTKLGVATKCQMLHLEIYKGKGSKKGKSDKSTTIAGTTYTEGWILFDQFKTSPTEVLPPGPHACASPRFIKILDDLGSTLLDPTELIKTIQNKRC